MSAMAPAGLGRVIDLAPPDRRHRRGRRALALADPQAQQSLVEILRAAAEIPRENHGPIARLEDLVYGRDRAVVEIRGRRPDAVERRGLVAASIQAVIALAGGTLLPREPTPQVKFHSPRGGSGG